jgi:hypothetical protein
VASSNDAIASANLEGIITSWNAAAERLYGYTAEEMVGTTGLGVLVPQDRLDEARLQMDTTARGEAISIAETQRRRKDGSLIDVEVLASPIVDSQGRVTGISSIVRDITERKRAEDAAKRVADELAEVERRYQRLFQRSPLPMWIYDKSSLAFVEVNEAAIAHYGFSRDQFLSMKITDIRPPEDVSTLLDDISHAGAQRSGRWRHIKRDGTPIDVSVIAHAVEFGDRPAEFVIAEDITDQARLQRQVQQSQRLDSLGQLAGGVAHDFNNLLAVIMNYASFVKKETAKAAEEDGARWQPVIDDVVQIERASERASGLIRQLLTFARREVTRPQVIDLNDVVSDIEQLLRRTLGEHVELVMAPSPELWRVLADVGQMEQVLVNLAINARDAMPQGGTLTIDTGNITVDEPYAAARPTLQPGDYVRLRVSDTGTGMDATTVQRAFEPFFTTKAPGEGSGLGLATVYGIIAQAGGYAQIYSEPGRGTTVTALLPAAGGEVAVTTEPPARAASLAGGEVIMLVEDEDALRGMTRRILVDSGYRVITAANGSEAIELAGAGGHIDLLLTDVVMPHMLGKEVAARVAELQPGIRVLYMSGYAQPVLASQGTLDPGVSLLEKPFGELALLAMITDALQKSTS